MPDFTISNDLILDYLSVTGGLGGLEVDPLSLKVLNNLGDLDNTATAVSNLGLVIGTDVQAYDAGLQSISGLTTAADTMIYTTAADTYATTTLTAFGRSLVDDVDAAAARTTLAAAPSLRAVNPVSASGAGVWGEDYYVDNTAAAVTLTFPTPLAGDVGLHSTIIVEGDPSAFNFVIAGTAISDRINGQATGAAAPTATFSAAATAWFAVDVRVRGADRFSVTSPAAFTLANV